MSAAPVQKLGRDVTHGTSCDKAYPHLLSRWIIARTLLPQHPVTSQCFRVRISLLPSLLNKADRLILTLPGMQTRQRKPAPPDLILKSDGPAGLLARSRDQAVASVSFHQVEGIRAGNPVARSLPVDPHPLEGLVNGLGADLGGCPPLLNTHDGD